MKKEDLFDAVGEIRDEYIESAAGLLGLTEDETMHETRAMIRPIRRVLLIAAAIVEKMHTAEGTSGNPQFVGTSADDLYSTLEKSAKEIMKSSEGMTFEAAFTEACSRDPETYRKYTEGV